MVLQLCQCKNNNKYKVKKFCITKNYVIKEILQQIEGSLLIRYYFKIDYVRLIRHVTHELYLIHGFPIELVIIL